MYPPDRIHLEIVLHAFISVSRTRAQPNNTLHGVSTEQERFRCVADHKSVRGRDGR